MVIDGLNVHTELGLGCEVSFTENMLRRRRPMGRESNR